jgi:hypothetical protein
MLMLASGCSSKDGAEAEGKGVSNGSASGGSASSDGRATSSGGKGGGSSTFTAGDGAVAMCKEVGDFSGPQLRDCNLPGACGRCMWEKGCAGFLFRCAKNTDCVCMAECVGRQGVGSTQACFEQCGLTQSPPGFSEWVKGASDMCWDEGCGTLGEPIPDPAVTTGGSVGAGTEPDCAFDPGVKHDPCGAVLQLQSADGSLCARIERRNDGPGNDANVSWTLIDVRIGPLGQVCHTDDPANLCWFSSHHNYAEWLHISCGGLHYDLNIGKGCGKLKNPSSNYRLLAFENGPADGECAPTADGTCAVVPPIELFPAP